MLSPLSHFGCFCSPCASAAPRQSVSSVYSPGRPLALCRAVPPPRNAAAQRCESFHWPPVLFRGLTTLIISFQFYIAFRPPWTALENSTALFPTLFQHSRVRDPMPHLPCAAEADTGTGPVRPFDMRPFPLLQALLLGSASRFKMSSRYPGEDRW
jgi:hypothetical protein